MFKATYTGNHRGSWHGAIKRDGKIVWTCPHCHKNRDQGSYTWGPSARDCAANVARILNMNATSRAAWEEFNANNSDVVWVKEALWSVENVG